MSKRWMILGVALALALVGCDDGDGGTDSGPPDGTDAGPPDGTDAGPPAGGPAVGKGMDLGALAAADYSCLGMRAAPTAGAEVTFTGQLNSFSSGAAVADLQVQVYPANMVDVGGACGAGCQMATTDAMGQFSAMAPADGWFAYRVLGGQGTPGGGTPMPFLTTIQFNEPAPAAAGETVGLTTIDQGTRDSIVLLLGTNADPLRTTVVGTIEDCAGDPIANVDLRIFGSAGEVTTMTSGSNDREFYFNGGGAMDPPAATIPETRRRATNVDGLYGLANLDVPGDSAYRVEAWGSTTDGEAPVLLGCEQVQVAPDSVTIINIGPLRSDAPSGCGS